MKQSKITKSGNVKLMLTREEADFLESLLGHHVYGYGKNRDLSTEIWAKLDDVGIHSNERMPTRDDGTIIELK